MKKIVLLLAAAAFTSAGFAQRMKISSANSYLQDKEYAKAAEAINEAVVNKSTSDDPDAWFKRGQVYFSMATDINANAEMKAQSAKNIDIATESFDKVLELKPNYNPEYINGFLNAIVGTYYNMGVNQFESKNYEAAYPYFIKAADLYKKYGGPSRWSIKDAKGKDLARVVRVSKTYAAESYMQLKNYNDALAIFEELTRTDAVPTDEQERVYTNMLMGYQNTSQIEKFNDILAKASKKFPNNKVFRTQQLNQVMSSGNADEAIAKLEKEVAANPADANMKMALGEVYRSAAEKLMKDGGEDVTKSTTAKEYMAKAQTNFEAAYAIKQDARVGYQLGYLNMVRGNGIIERMNKLGTSANDMKKYEIFNAEMTKSFAAAIPYFENTVASLETGGKYKSDQESLDLYYATLKAVQQAYSKTDNDTKAKETFAKIKSLEKK